MSLENGWYSNVHPVLRIVCFIILSLFLALGDVVQLSVATIIVAMLYVTTLQEESLAGLWPMLRRMRWFFLSIFIIYAWFTPGTPLLPSIDVSWLPTISGVLEGGHRLMALVLIIAAVHWLLFVTKRDQLVSALYWLVAPVQLFGFSRQRFAVRLALTLNRVVEVQDLVSNKVQQAGVTKGDVKAYAAATATIAEEVIRRAEQSPCEQIEIDVADRPTGWQWALPILLIMFMMIVGRWS